MRFASVVNFFAKTFLTVVGCWQIVIVAFAFDTEEADKTLQKVSSFLGAAVSPCSPSTTFCLRVDRTDFRSFASVVICRNWISSGVTRLRTELLAVTYQPHPEVRSQRMAGP